MSKEDHPRIPRSPLKYEKNNSRVWELLVTSYFNELCNEKILLDEEDSKVLKELFLEKWTWI